MAFYCNGKKGLCECDILCADCQHYDNTGGKKWQTNADRIRAMSDEELARFIESTTIAGCPDPVRNCRASCIECIMDYLQQPAEVEDA